MVEENSIGKLLREARDKKGISLEDIASKTKININILRALEADDLDNLPNITYVRGFVINFAKTVGLDPEVAKKALVAAYQGDSTPQSTISEDETQITPAPEVKEVTNPSITKAEGDDEEELKERTVALIKHVFNKKVIISAMAVVAFVVVVTSVTKFFQQIQNENKVEPAPQVTEAPQTQPVLKTEEVKGKLDKIADNPNPVSTLKDENADLLKMDAAKKFAKSVEDKQSTEKKEEVKVVEETKKEEVKKEEPKKEVAEKKKEEPKTNLKPGEFPFKKFYKTPAKLYDIVKDADEAKNPEFLPSNIKSAYIKGKQNIYINAVKADTWVSYKSDDKAIRRFVLKKGRRLLIRGEVVQLFMGNYNAVKVFYNNDLVSAQTKSGVKSLIFPPSEVENFELPLFPSYQGILYTSKEYKKKMVKEE